jgi:hypothetical protein
MTPGTTSPPDPLSSWRGGGIKECFDCGENGIGVLKDLIVRESQNPQAAILDEILSVLVLADLAGVNSPIDFDD